MAIYSGASLFLTGMQPYLEISPVSAFPNAFRSVGANALAEFISLGEIVTLPIVVLVTIMAQPRLQYALAVDGLLPSFFGEIDEYGNLWKGTLFAGGIMIVVSALVPFDKLNDMISGAVLLVLALTDTSVVLLWHEGTASLPHLPSQLMFLFHVLCVVCSLVLTRLVGSLVGPLLGVLSIAAVSLTCFAVYRWCPRSTVFGGNRHHYHEEQLQKEEGYFATPFVPLLPCLAIFSNWYLIVQLDLVGLAMLVVFLAVSAAYYFAYGGRYSVGNRGGWEKSPIIELEHAAAATSMSPLRTDCT